MFGVPKEAIIRQIGSLRQDLNRVERKTERLEGKLNDQEDILIALADQLGYRIERETRKYVIVEKDDEQSTS